MNKQVSGVTIFSQIIHNNESFESLNLFTNNIQVVSPGSSSATWSASDTPVMMGSRRTLCSMTKRLGTLCSLLANWLHRLSFDLPLDTPAHSRDTLMTS
jgi:hypothetical protein